MVSAWKGMGGGEGSDLSDDQSVELARRLGAGRVLVGSIVGARDDFTVNARMLRVPGGEPVGDAVVIEGSSDEIRETIRQFASQVLSMEAGVERGQVDYLDDVPLAALEAYLEGRAAYRGAAYFDSRNAFSRALDLDSTFALAALGAREAAQMGMDADRFKPRGEGDSAAAREPRSAAAPGSYVCGAMARGIRPAERHRAGIGTGAGADSPAPGQGRGVVSVRRPPPAPARGGSRRKGGSIGRRKRSAGEPTSTRDCGSSPSTIAWLPGFDGDTVGVRAIEALISDEATGEQRERERRRSSRTPCAIPNSWRGLDANLEGLSYAAAQQAWLPSFFPRADLPLDHMARAFDRQEETAVRDSDREQALEQWHSFLRSAGRSAEADDQLRLLEAAFGPRPADWVGAHLYWDGLREPAEAAAHELAEAIDGSSGPLPWSEGGREACMLELWRLREGDRSRVSATIERVEAGALDPDPRHDASALCALTLRAMNADAAESPEAGALLDRLVEVLDQGPFAVLTWPSLEAAWMLEERGDLAAASRVAGYISGSNPTVFAGSTVHREAGRLADLAGDDERARFRYRWYLNTRSEADARFEQEDAAIRARLTELEGDAR